MKSDKVKLSIVLPVYNVERYLRECLDSIYSAGIESFEVIAVNDGSTDGSLAILLEYKEKCENLIIVDQENKGLSGARNSGLEKVSGEFVFFLDSDDILTKGVSVLKYIEQIVECDIFMFDALEFIDDISNGILESDTFRNEKIEGYPIKHYASIEIGHGLGNSGPIKSVSLKGVDYLNILKKNDHYIPVVWRRIYRSRFIKENMLSYVIDVSPAEDDLFMFESLLLNPSIVYFNVPVVLYRRRGDSISGNNDRIRNYNSYSIVLSELLKWKKMRDSFQQPEILNWIFDVFIRRKYRERSTIREALQLIEFSRRSGIRIYFSSYLKIGARLLKNLVLSSK
ncbi:glycosyltransferase [Ravibacter arvi]